MTGIRVGDWVRLGAGYYDNLRKIQAAFDRATGGVSASGPAPHQGEWAVVVPERPEEFLRTKLEPGQVFIRWPDGQVQSAHTRVLDRYEPPAARQVLADWLHEHERPKLASRVAAPSPEVWIKAVAAAWWHQPEARALCEATNHPTLWASVWQCAVALRLGRPVRADITGWGVILWLEVGSGRATCPIGAGIEATPESVANAVAILLDAERDAGVTTTSTEAT